MHFGPTPPHTLQERIRLDVAASPAPRLSTRARSLMAISAAAVLCLAILAISSELLYRRLAMGLDVASDHTERLSWMLPVLLALTVVLTTVALWRGRHGFGAGVAGLVLAGTLTAPLYAALAVSQPLHAGEAGVANLPISPWGGRCALMAGVVGIVAMAALTVALRRAVPVASTLRGAVLGAAAGAWAGLAVLAFCPSGDRLHLLIGHALPIVALTLIGMLVTPRFLRP